MQDSKVILITGASDGIGKATKGCMVNHNIKWSIYSTSMMQTTERRQKWN